MDRNTIVGLLLIGLILTTFTLFNQPTQEELAQQQKTEQQRKKAESKTDTTEKEELAKESKETVDDSEQKSKEVQKPKVEKQTFRLENDKMVMYVSSKGGSVEKVYLKEFETYREFAKKDDKVMPLALFSEGDFSNDFLIGGTGEKAIRTKNLDFVPVEIDNKSVTLRAQTGNKGSVTVHYDLSANDYNVVYNVRLKNLAAAIEKGVQLNWESHLLKTERLLSEQRKITTLCFERKEDGFDYLSEAGDDDDQPEQDLNWVAHKQSYFSSILRPDRPFIGGKNDLEVKNYSASQPRVNTHLKKMEATLALDFARSDNASMGFTWYFGPNDYEVLRAHGKNYDDILNFGWGLFRWINVYAVQPVFNALIEFGFTIGIAILLLTVVLKLVLMPIQWKMFVSSAKMRILKPEIDELNKKYPNKEDAMKKQMDMMTLYRESGASPLAGCLPALLQMPILLAVFRFFPASFELRQKSFLWAEDLSSYDSIWDFGVYIWPYGDHVSLFTLLMAGATLLYTHMNSGQMQQPSQPGMPNMKVIMYIMPVMMIFFFNNFSSGLSYYYFVSTLLSILLMVLIKQFFVDEEKLKAKMAERKAAKAASPKKGKSKFQERLEQMQKLQQERAKRK